MTTPRVHRVLTGLCIAAAVVMVIGVVIFGAAYVGAQSGDDSSDSADAAVSANIRWSVLSGGAVIKAESRRHRIDARIVSYTVSGTPDNDDEHIVLHGFTEGLLAIRNAIAAAEQAAADAAATATAIATTPTPAP